MSLLVTAKTPAGIVLAADSRLTFTNGQDGTHSDRATKVWVLAPPNQHVGVGMYGKAAISLRNAESLIDEFGRLTRGRKTTPVIADELVAFLRSRWDGYGQASFMVAGYDGTSHYGYVFELVLPDLNAAIEHYGGAAYGLAFGGQRNFAQRLFLGHDEGLFGRLKDKLELNPAQQQALGVELMRTRLDIPLHNMPIAETVQLARYLILTTSRGQRFVLGEQGVGGPARAVVLERGKVARLV